MENRKIAYTDYLIIGNSAGGIGAAEAIREIDHSGRLVMVSDEPYQAYSRPLISEYVSHERTIETMLFRSPDFYDRNGIELLAGVHVNGIDTDNRIARFEDGTEYSWGKLLLATGGNPIVPPVKGWGKEGVFNFIKLDDARGIDTWVSNTRHAVVIGGGLIGLSLTQALSRRGVAVTIVEMKDRILNMILDETASAAAADALVQHGIRIITSDTVAEIAGNGQVKGVRLNSGIDIECEMVVAAIGVTPQVDLARNSGIKTGRGITVDQHMATDHEGIYACGDAAEGYDFITGTYRLTPVWPNAYIGGRTAGHNMAGKEETYPGGTAMNSLNYFGIDIISAGLASAPDNRHYEELVYSRDGIYKKLILKDGLIKGMIFVGDIEKAGIIFGLMRDSINVKSYKNMLLGDDFGLIDLPANLRRARMGTLTAGLHIVPLKETEEQPVAGE